MTKRKTTPPKKKTSQTARGKKAAPARSFALSRSDTPFMTLKLTKQSLYWLILGVIVIAFGAWIMKLQSDIQTIYDAIDANDSMIINDTTLKHKSR